MELSELLRFFDAYRTYLTAAFAGFIIAKLVPHFLLTSREAAVSFSWERPAEADPAWKGDVLEHPHIHADGKDTITAYDPAHAYRMATFPSPSPQDMADLVCRAEKASLSWRQTTFAQRRQVLRSLLEWTLQNKEQIAQVCCRDTGKTMLDAAFGEILTTCEKIRWMLVYGETYLKPEHRPTSWLLAHKVSHVHYEPFGVVGAIVSWNYPFHNLFSPVLAAIMSGNAIVVKTSEQVAWSSFHFAKALQSCLAACGHNPDVVHVATGCEAEAAKAFTKDPRIGHLTFIGSDAVGKEVARNAAEALTPVTLELGGKDPLIILASADIKFFQDVFLRAVFTGAGQGCIASERFIIHQAKYDEFLATMYKRVEQLRSGIDVGAMISGPRLAHLERLVADAVKAGARVLAGGNSYKHPDRPGAHHFQPTLICDVTEDMAIAREECFAPIMLAMRAKDTDECIRIANGSKYALGSAVFGRDKADCRYVASRLVCGMVCVNDFGTFYLNQHLPFGGTKASGYHRFGGPEGLRSLCNVKAVMEDRFHGWVQTSIPGPLTYPVKEARKSWRFIDGMINLMYAPSWSRRIAGLYGMASA